MIATEYIPIEKFNLWKGLFASSGGRYVVNPSEVDQSVIVRYAFEDVEKYVNFSQEWQRLNTPIVEKRRTFWGRIKRRLWFK